MTASSLAKVVLAQPWVERKTLPFDMSVPNYQKIMPIMAFVTMLPLGVRTAVEKAYL